MDWQEEASEVAVRDAASVVMLRDGAAGLEVFLLRRNGLADVLGGAYVFPGGKVDREDAHADAQALLGESDATLHAALHEPQLVQGEASAIWFAALREAFEETGVLYAQGADARMAALAGELHREGRSFDEVLAMMRAKLDAHALKPWVRWITPSVGGVMRKRFDTRFFLATVPQGQEARHDDHEATESVWLSPRTALAQYRDGAIELAPPQIMSLAHLARHPDAASAMHEAASRPPPTVLPHPFDDGGVRAMCYPGDPLHPVGLRALPGPTRLHYRNRRFEPPAGFESLFSDG